MQATIHMKDGSEQLIKCPEAQSGNELRRWLRENIKDTVNIDIVIPWQYCSALVVYPEEIPTVGLWYDLHCEGSGRYAQTEYCKRSQLRRANWKATIEARRAGVPFSKLNQANGGQNP